MVCGGFIHCPKEYQVLKYLSLLDLNGFEENKPDFQPVLSAGSPQDSLSYADDFISSHVSESAAHQR